MIAVQLESTINIACPFFDPSCAITANNHFSHHGQIVLFLQFEAHSRPKLISASYICKYCLIYSLVPVLADSFPAFISNPQLNFGLALFFALQGQHYAIGFYHQSRYLFPFTGWYFPGLLKPFQFLFRFLKVRIGCFRD